MRQGWHIIRGILLAGGSNNGRKSTMTRMIRCALAVATLGLLASAAGAADRGTAAEARALLDQAASHYQQAGRQAALADFNKPNGSFVKNDLYVFCIGPDNKVD